MFEKQAGVSTADGSGCRPIEPLEESGVEGVRSSNPMKSKITSSRLVSTIRALVLVSFLSTAAWGLELGLLRLRTVTTLGSGESTVVDLVENPDGTIALFAEQSGYLAHFGAFTGNFDYLAHIDYNTGTTFIGGDGVIHLAGGDLTVSVQILEVGIDYPRPYTGILTVTGGTGRFASASGFFEITGIDEKSLTDGFALTGVLFGVAAK